MYRRPYHKAIAVAAMALLAAGCVQATRHSNTMVFGTNTTFGVKAGAGTGEIPEIVVGYDRQEAVIMPLVANTGSNSNRNLLTPCNLTGSITVSGQSQFAVHPCSLVAVNGKAMDSYSVLASFGAKYDVGSGDARGGLAQYFATGMAAQMLALNGGAAVVAIGDAATKAAETKPDKDEIKSLFGDEAAFGLGVKAAESFPDFQSSLIAKLAAAKDDAEVKSKIESFETRSGISTSMRAICATKSACINAVNENEYGQHYNFNSDAMDTALINW